MDAAGGGQGEADMTRVVQLRVSGVVGGKDRGEGEGRGRAEAEW